MIDNILRAVSTAGMWKYRREKKIKVTNHIWWELFARQIFDILVLRIDSFRKLHPIDYLFIDPHAYFVIKQVVILLHIFPND